MNLCKTEYEIGLIYFSELEDFADYILLTSTDSTSPQPIIIHVDPREGIGCVM